MAEEGNDLGASVPEGSAGTQTPGQGVLAAAEGRKPPGPGSGSVFGVKTSSLGFNSCSAPQQVLVLWGLCGTRAANATCVRSSADVGLQEQLLSLLL